jgi:hypothetical protein
MALPNPSKRINEETSEGNWGRKVALRRKDETVFKRLHIPGFRGAVNAPVFIHRILTKTLLSKPFAIPSHASCYATKASKRDRGFDGHSSIQQPMTDIHLALNQMESAVRCSMV